MNNRRSDKNNGRGGNGGRGGEPVRSRGRGFDKSGAGKTGAPHGRNGGRAGKARSGTGRFDNVRSQNLSELDDEAVKTGNQSGDKIEGRNAVTEALAADRTFNRIWILKPEGGKRLEPALAKILDEANKRGIVVTRAERSVLDRISTTHNHQGVIATVAPHDYADLDDIISKARDQGKAPILIALDEIKDAYNLGSILRIADCCGVDGVIIPERRSVSLDSMVAKASAGAMEYVPVARVTNLAQTLRNLKEKEGFWVCGTDMDGDTSYDKADYSGSLVIVIGSEGEGMREGVRKCCDFTVEIPMCGHVNSLNAAVAAGVVVFEAARHRRAKEE